MRLNKILQGLKIRKKFGYRDCEIKCITHISQDVIDDSIFICIAGNNYDGNDYITSAVSSGASCIITEKEIELDGVVVIVVENVRVAMSVVAKNFYNRCCDKLDIIGVIGTAGKTTTSTMIGNILSNNGFRVGIIGTNGIYIDNIRQENKFTTPDPIDLHYVFYQMKMLGVTTVVMEISAQAISLYKLYGVKLKVGVFTNISSEHLDFFGSMENYAKCKMNYFSSANMSECVVNIDDFFGMELAYKVDIPCISYGIENPANVFAVNIKSDIEGTSFVANVFDNLINVNSCFVGNYNVYNLLAAISVVRLLKLKCSDIEKSVNQLKPIPGRFNVYKYGNAKIVIDFAHTPDSIDKLLSLIKANATAKIISVVGCVGYSDRQKRIDMIMAVDKYSDYVIMTTDNRGTTPFQDIVDDMICGVKNAQYEIIEDRKTAISKGVKLLADNDILVLIGKGAEDFQKIGDERLPYSDIESIEELLKVGKI